MTAKKISELTAKTPVSTDVIPVADPTTGIAGKSTIAQIVSASGGGLPAITGGGLVVAANPLATNYELRRANLADASSAMVPVTATSINILGVTSCEKLRFGSGSIYTNLTTLQSDDLVTLTNYSNTQSLRITGFPVLQSLNLNALMFCHSVNIFSNPQLITISIQSLMKTYNFYIANNDSLVTINGSYLSEIGGSLTIINCPLLSSYFFPFALKVVGGNVDLSGNGLTQVHIDSALQFLANLDGNNGKCLWGSGLSCNLSGGTNAAPSATGLAAKAILVSRGCTVTHN
jgi:hypothetical protein